MAVYTEVSESALAEFLDHYDIGIAVSLKGIAEGVENSNYFLATTEGRYILTLYERRVNAEDLPYFLNLMSHVAEAGLPSAGVLTQKNGQRLGRLAGRPAAIIEFLEGLSVNQPKPAHCAAAGKALADFHGATDNYAARRENTLSLDGWTEMAQKIGDNANKCLSGLSESITAELAYLQDNWPTDLPSGVTHSDLFPDNVLFSGNEVTGLIDFYFAANDFRAYDLAVMVNAWCFDAAQNFQPANAKALIEHYDAARPLNAAETIALPVLMRGAAIRFMLTRLYDWLNQRADALVKVKDPLDYYRILTFHQQQKDLADYVV